MPPKRDPLQLGTEKPGSSSALMLPTVCERTTETIQGLSEVLCIRVGAFPFGIKLSSPPKVLLWQRLSSGEPRAESSHPLEVASLDRGYRFKKSFTCDTNHTSCRVTGYNCHCHLLLRDPVNDSALLQKSHSDYHRCTSDCIFTIEIDNIQYKIEIMPVDAMLSPSGFSCGLIENIYCRISKSRRSLD